MSQRDEHSDEENSLTEDVSLTSELDQTDCDDSDALEDTTRPPSLYPELPTAPTMSDGDDNAFQAAESYSQQHSLIDDPENNQDETPALQLTDNPWSERLRSRPGGSRSRASSCSRAPTPSSRPGTSQSNRVSNSQRPSGRARPLTYSRPELDGHFKRVFNDNQWSNQCKYCLTSYKGHNSDRFLDHLAKKCVSAPQSVREHFNSVIRDSEHIGPTGRSDMNTKFARIIIKNNIPLRICGCKLFISFMKEYCRGGKIASQERMMDFYVTRLAARTDRKFAKLVADSCDYSLMIEFDHWTDPLNRSILGITATFPKGTKHLMTLEDVSLIGHSSDAIVPSLVAALSKIPSRKINCIISDNASNCVSARAKLCTQQNFAHLLNQRCLPHWLNRIGSYVCQREKAVDTITTCNKIVYFLSKDAYILAQLKKAGANRCRRAVATRWYSTVDMLESLLAVKEIAVPIVRKYSGKAELISLMTNDELWVQIRALTECLRPIVDCIAVGEKKGSTVGETFHHILQFARLIMNRDWTDNYNLAAIEAFLLYFSDEKLGEEMGLLMAAYFLDRNYKMDYITEEGSIKVYKTIIRVARLSGFNRSALSSDLAHEFDAFCRQEGTFGSLPLPGETAAQWWSRTPDVAPGVLRRVALRITGLQASSANMERIFSHLKYIQSPNRLRFNLSSLLDIAKVRVADFEEDEFYMDAPISDSSSPTKNFGVLDRASQFVSRIGRGSSQRSSCSQSQHGPRPSLLTSTKTVRSYEDFKELIDFTIINEFEENAVNVVLQQDEEETVVDAAIDQLRVLRESRRL